MNVLLLAAWMALILCLLGFWLVRRLTWRQGQLSYTPDPSDPNVRTANELSEDTSGHSSFRRESWREVHVGNVEWVRDGAYVESNRAGAKMAQGTYRNGKRQGLWTYWRDDGSVDGSRTGTYDNDRLIERALTPRGDFEDGDK